MPVQASSTKPGQAAAAVAAWPQLQLTAAAAVAGCDSLANAITQMASTWNHSVHIAGRAVAQKYYVDVMQREVALFVSIGLVVHY